jgi:hypothetical protein
MPPRRFSAIIAIPHITAKTAKQTPTVLSSFTGKDEKL